MKEKDYIQNKRSKNIFLICSTFPFIDCERDEDYAVARLYRIDTGTFSYVPVRTLEKNYIQAERTFE